MTVIVVGSANLDRVCRVERIPGPGETVLATASAEHCGGKGNNQVIAATRSGASASFLAALGSDEAGSTLRRTLDDAGVTSLIRTSDAPTGIANITVDDSAENSIVVSPGANAALIDLTEAEHAAIRAADVLLMQLEIPVETVIAAAEVASAAGTYVVLNAAPIQRLPERLLRHVDLLIVNEHEAAELAYALQSDRQQGDPREAAAILAGIVPDVIVTLGAAGSLIVSAGASPLKLPSYSVQAVDTTGAGDTFCGALVAALDADGAAVRDLVEATSFATAAAALSVQSAGAVSSIPSLKETNDFRDQHEHITTS
ncbi:PfkB family carbohydrate kinase [Lysinibacter cavernae]|uniref:Ribokinase n=1 Tax=Lysinibacter cavernae TaxID=1640652 RepID=A0A7X5R2I4_9MICO|nr:ribokinase [Lysinibacter cavernae]